MEDRTRIESLQVGSKLGMSARVRDDGGDMDLTTAGSFRRNMLMETLRAAARREHEEVPVGNGPSGRR